MAGSCEELLKKVELKSQNSSPVATMETSRKGCGIEQQQMNGGHFVTAESNVHAIAERSITPDSGENWKLIFSSNAMVSMQSFIIVILTYNIWSLYQMEIYFSRYLNIWEERESELLKLSLANHWNMTISSKFCVPSWSLLALQCSSWSQTVQGLFMYHVKCQAAKLWENYSLGMWKRRRPCLAGVSVWPKFAPKPNFSILKAMPILTIAIVQWQIYYCVPESKIDWWH